MHASYMKYRSLKRLLKVDENRIEERNIFDLTTVKSALNLNFYGTNNINTSRSCCILSV